MKKMMWLFSILTFLFLGNVANAETDLLSLGSYNEGDTPSYGENVVIEQDETTGVKWITGARDASGNLKKLKYSTSLSGDFELFIKADVPVNWFTNDSNSIEIFLIANDEYKIQLEINNKIGYLFADGGRADYDQSDSWTSNINQVELKVVNNIAKLYINDVFSTKITLKPDLTYTQILVNLHGGDQLYEFTTNSTASNNNNVPATDEPQTCNTAPVNLSTSENCTADYTNGQLHVPCVAVSDPFGGKTIYDIKMNQQSGSFTFDLDMGSVKPK